MCSRCDFRSTAAMLRISCASSSRAAAQQQPRGQKGPEPSCERASENLHWRPRPSMHPCAPLPSPSAHAASLFRPNAWICMLQAPSERNHWPELLKLPFPPPLKGRTQGQGDSRGLALQQDEIGDQGGAAAGAAGTCLSNPLTHHPEQGQAEAEFKAEMQPPLYLNGLGPTAPHLPQAEARSLPLGSMMRRPRTKTLTKMKSSRRRRKTRRRGRSFPEQRLRG